MKIDVYIPRPLLEEAKKLAANHQTTVKALVEEGLRRVIGEHQRSGMFRLPRPHLKARVFSQICKGPLGKPCVNKPRKVAEGDGG